MDWSTDTAYIKMAPLIQYICLKYMREMHIITEKMNKIKSIAYLHKPFSLSLL